MTVEPQFKGLAAHGWKFCPECGLLAPLEQQPVEDVLALAAFSVEQPGVVNAICDGHPASSNVGRAGENGGNGTPQGGVNP